jgi:hypothetical protein
MVSGDFDGNGEADYALIIERHAVPSVRVLEFLAFLEERGSFRGSC